MICRNSPHPRKLSVHKRDDLPCKKAAQRTVPLCGPHKISLFYRFIPSFTQRTVPCVTDERLGYLTGADILCDGGCVAGGAHRKSPSAAASRPILSVNL